MRYLAVALTIFAIAGCRSKSGGPAAPAPGPVVAEKYDGDKHLVAAH